MLSTYSSYTGAKQANAVAKNNEVIAGYAAKDALRRGEEEAQKVQRQARMLKGSQRASMAARGLDLQEGTPAQLLDETDFFASMDAATARTNARNEAWGIKARAGNYVKQNPLMAGATSLLSGGSTVADKWYARNG